MGNFDFGFKKNNENNQSIEVETSNSEMPNIKEMANNNNINKDKERDIDPCNMSLKDFEYQFCKREIPTGWNVYEWVRQHKETAIAQAFFRVRRIMNRADFIQVNISGGKDSTLSFEIASLELRYRKQLSKAIEAGYINEPYEYKDIVYDPSTNRNDYDNYEKTEEAYQSFENINLNVPMIYLNSQDAELIFSDAINHIQYDVNLAHGYGLYVFDGKIVCGHDIIPSAVRDTFKGTSMEGIEIYADLWEFFEADPLFSGCIVDIDENDLRKLNIDEKLIKIIGENRFSYASKRINERFPDSSNSPHDFVCVVKGDQSGHMFYKCLSISYQDGSSYGSGRFVAWDKTKESIWCREMPTREQHGLDIITNYNMCETNYLPVSKIKPEMVELHKEDIVNIDGIDCIPNWGFGRRSLCESDKIFEKMFGSLMMKNEDGSYKELWTYISQSDEDAGGSETDTFARWILANVPDFMTTDFVGGKPRTHATQIYSLVSIRASESFDRYTILKQSEYFTGQYASKTAK